jgi:hypothetical protein
VLTGWLEGFVFLLVNALVVFSSWCLANYLLEDKQSLSLRVVATGILSFVHATLVVLLLGVVLRYLNALSVPVLSLLVSTAILYFTRAYRQPFLSPAGRAVADTFSARDYFLYLVSCLFIVQIIVLLFKVVWLPPHIWDVFVYHLPPAVEWFQQGYIPPVLDTSVGRINGAPLGMTVLAYWFFIFFGDDVLVEMPMLLWALLLVPVSIAVLRQSGLTRPWSLKFAVLIFFLPIVIMQAVTVKDHLGLNVGLLAGLLFLAEFLKTGKTRLLLIAAAAFGLMLGYKIAAPMHILMALLVFSMLLWFRQRSFFTEIEQRLKLAKTTVLSALIVLAVGGYWYVRNLLFFGRLHGTYGTSLSESGENLAKDGGAIDAALNIFAHSGLLRRNLAELLPRFFDYQFAYGADLVGISGYGPQFAAFGLLALVAAIGAFFSTRLRQQPIFLFSSVAILLFVALMFVNFNSNSYRILSFFPMVLIAFAGVQLFHNGFLDQKWPRRLTNNLIVLSIAWSFLTLLPPLYTNLLRLNEFVSLDQESRTSANFTSWFIRPRPDFYRLMDIIPVTEPIAHVDYRGSYSNGEATIDTWHYLYMDRQWQRKIHALHLPEYFVCQDDGHCKTRPALKTFLKNNGVSLLSSCKANRCLNIEDETLLEIMPGLYYFLGDR